MAENNTKNNTIEGLNRDEMVGAAIVVDLTGLSLGMVQHYCRKGWLEAELVKRVGVHGGNKVWTIRWEAAVELRDAVKSGQLPLWRLKQKKRLGEITPPTEEELQEQQKEPASYIYIPTTPYERSRLGEKLTPSERLKALRDAAKKKENKNV